MKRSFLNKRHPKYLERKAKLKQRSAKGVAARERNRLAAYAGEAPRVEWRGRLEHTITFHDLLTGTIHTLDLRRGKRRDQFAAEVDGKPWRTINVARSSCVWYKNKPSQSNQLWNGFNRRHIITMPTTTRQIPELNQMDKLRFWSRSEKRGPNECWNWVGAKTYDGYGAFKMVGFVFRSHRVAFHLAGGLFTPEKQCCCHHCDNKICVNPSHLFAGSDLDNAVDRQSKLRGNNARGERHKSRTKPESVTRGEKQHLSKLTESSVRQIRARHKSGEPYVRLGIEFGVARGSIRMVVLRKTWKHIQ